MEIEDTRTASERAMDVLKDILEHTYEYMTELRRQALTMLVAAFVLHALWGLCIVGWLAETQPSFLRVLGVVVMIRFISLNQKVSFYERLSDEEVKLFREIAEEEAKVEE
jgi:uncharacterized ion transporter superfamily protein YfcC